MATQSIFGTSLAETLYGTNDHDPSLLFDTVFYGNGGADIVYAGGNNDWVWASAGDPSNVTFFGQDGDDVLVGFDGNDWLQGDGGNDTVIGGTGNDILLGGDGNDTLWAGDGSDTLLGGEGNDVLVGDMDGETGDDWLWGGAGDDIAYGGDGADVLYGGDGTDWLFGFAGNDTINGEAGDDVLLGGDGNDVIFDLSGNNLIAGGKGQDQITTGDGNDTIYSGGYKDFTPPHTIYVFPGIQTLGDPPEDPALFGVDSAIIWAGSRDGLGSTNSWVKTYGEYTNTPVPDVLPTGAGDYISAGGGNDAIYSGDFDDTIFDGAGNDYVSPGMGENTLYMDAGLDTYQLTGSASLPFVTDPGFAGILFTSDHTVRNPDTLIYDHTSAIDSGNMDEIFGFSISDGDKIRYLEGLGQDVTWANDANGDLLLSNASGVFAKLHGVSAADFAGSFEYFHY
jgi:Ca2+-binding RTX toxin-like protein